MRSDVITIPKSESFPDDNDGGVRLLAYAYAISGKDGKASSKEKAQGGSGITGLFNEFEKTRLDA